MERMQAEVAMQQMAVLIPPQKISAAALYRAKAREALSRRNWQREQMWDATPHRTCPSNLRGLKPITQEPWSRDAIIYARKTGNFERVYNADQFGDGSQKREEYNDESALDSNNGYLSRITATGLKKNSSLGGQPLWDSSPLRHTPYVLRGISPVTREPWAVDEQIYNRDTTRSTINEERGVCGYHL